MDNIWQQFGDGTQAFKQFTYTPCIDLTDGQAPSQDEYAVGSERNEVASGVAHPPGTTPTPPLPKKGVPKRSKNFTLQEDETLCSAFLNVSKDPAVGTNQTMSSYWARITAYFHEMKKTNFVRSQSSLQHRWGDIQRDTSWFCGFFAEIERKRQSGKSEDDKIKDALQMYQGVLGHPFKFMHCWFILKNEIKWTATLGSTSSPPPPRPVPWQEADGQEHTAPPVMPRPPGRDKAKKPRSSSASSNSTSYLQALEKMHEERTSHDLRLEDAARAESKENAHRADMKIALLKDQVRIQEGQMKIQEGQMKIQTEMLELQRLRHEERVMNMDVERMAPWVREYYIKLQQEISARKTGGTGSGGSNSGM